MSIKSRIDKLEQVLGKQIGSENSIDFSLISNEDLERIIKSTSENEVNLIIEKYKGTGSNKIDDKSCINFNCMSKEDLNKIAKSTDANEILQIARKYMK